MAGVGTRVASLNSPSAKDKYVYMIPKHLPDKSESRLVLRLAIKIL
jgi:hypothetical protein